MSKPQANFATIMEPLLERDLDNQVMRVASYIELVDVCAKVNSLSMSTAETVVDICTKDLTADSKYLTNALHVLNCVLGRIMEGKCPSGPYLLPSAVAVLNIVKLTSNKGNFVQIHQNTLNTLSQFPDEILIALSTSYCNDLINIFDLQMSGKNLEDSEKVFLVLIKILKVLPVETKKLFVKDGLDIWLKSIIPAVSLHMNNQSAYHTLVANIQAIELMIDTLVKFDYSRNCYWEKILSDICEQNKYPKLLKFLIDNRNDCWYRLWIIFIKLLKDDITRVRPKSGVSPVNALLPVVELAFRLDPSTRYRAFECWRVLIDNFSEELYGSDNHVLHKRLKLLVTPLKINNAKTTETVMTKLDTWWHLIRRFYYRMDRLTDMVLIPFLTFCFGKKDSTGVVPGQISKEVAVRCAEMFVEIVSDVKHEGPASVPRLDGKLLNTTLLVDHWVTWVHSLMVAIQSLSASESDNESHKNQLLRMWEGFVMTLADIPANQIRADMVSCPSSCCCSGSLLTATLDTLTQSTKQDLSVDVLNITMSLFANERARQLLKTKNDEGPIYVILKIVLNVHMNGRQVLLEKYSKSEDVSADLKPLTDFIMDASMCNADQIIKWLFSESVADLSRTFIWTALVDSIIESKNTLNSQSLDYMIQWPVKNMNLFLPNDYTASYKWSTLYSFIHPMVDNKLDKTIFDLLTERLKAGSVKIDFALSVALSLLKQQLISNSSTGFEKVTKILYEVMKRVENLDCLANKMANLIDTLVLLVNKITETDPKNVELVKCCVDVVKVVLSLVRQEHKPIKNQETFMNTLLKKIYELFLIKEHSHLKPSIDQLLKKPAKPKTYKNTTTTTPEAKIVKKAPNIVSTIVENGEEFVVVKSHWKFNPKKLTENQKDKLKRKREDIPALYQDLSQSQDEARLVPWRTDSQDTSTTNTTSKSNTNSKTNDDFTNILKNIPSTDVVPHIMENIIANSVTLKNTEKAPEPVIDNQKTTKPTENRTELSVTNKNQPKTPKTPRMTIKDRVFRNVKNLVEKSGLGVIPSPNGLNHTINENDLKTPVSKANNTTEVINSAPPQISSERPARAIKKPKKFEDLEVFAVKRRRRSQSTECSTKKDKNSLPDSNKVVVNINEAVEIVNKEIGNSNKTVASDDKAVEKSIKAVESGNNEVENNNKEVENKNEVAANDKNCKVALPPDEPGIETITQENKTVTTQENVPVIEVLSSQTSQCAENIKKQPEKERIEERIDVLAIENRPNEALKENTENPSQIIEEITTPAKTAKKKDKDSQSTTKKKRSRIEKQLLIDMVEGHPLLQSQSEKRLTRKNQPNDTDSVSKRRKSLIEKSFKIKAELENAGITDKKTKEKEKSETKLIQEVSTIISDSEDNLPESQDVPTSEDVIESSQDSTLTTISMKSATKKKIPVVELSRANIAKYKSIDTQKLLDEFNNDIAPLSDTSLSQESKDDIELPKNKTVEEDISQKDLTENMDTLPIESSSDVIVIEDHHTPIVINTDNTSVSRATQEMAEADTLSMDVDNEPISISSSNDETNVATALDEGENDIFVNNDTTVATLGSTKPVTSSAEAMTDVITESSNTGSPQKNETQRKKDFLNDTIEISPIKTLSPIRDEKSPSPETSSDFVVIKLTTPVQSNGEPFNDKCDSPEIFTEEKISPDKRDQSPPRKPVTPSNNSPSSSLSLKKNRPQVWSNGRAAQMLGLCVPEKLSIINPERSNNEEPKKMSPLNTSARRNLKILYNCVANNENQPANTSENDSEESENFLKFKRMLPTADCSPSGPILKRKLADIADEATVSPASKRKRVSFHDPPVSTTVAVQKYIEPSGIRSPSNSAIKRQERQMRAYCSKKSPKRLENVFRLETVLTKAVESFSDSEPTISNETEISLDDTPAVEVIKTSELNDTDPICPELIDCSDPIEIIATELSSPTTKDLLVKELEGQIDTIGDMAKLTELEVNRLCIKAPKVKVAKKVLTEYASKRVISQDNLITEDLSTKVAEIEKVHMEVQTNELVTTNSEMQTLDVPTAVMDTQTDVVSTSHCSAQTNESGSKSTKDIVATCLAERPDFVDQLVDQLQKPSVQRISERLPFDDCIALLSNKMTASNSIEVLNRTLDRSETTGTDNLKVLQDYLASRFDSKRLILFCSQLLQKVHDKPT